MYCNKVNIQYLVLEELKKHFEILFSDLNTIKHDKPAQLKKSFFLLQTIHFQNFLFKKFYHKIMLQIKLYSSTLQQ